MKKIKLFINLWRVLPFYFIISKSGRLSLLREDNIRWKKILGLENISELEFIAYLLISIKEYRNLVYNRFESAELFSKCIFTTLFPLYDTLFIYTKDIGPGMFIQHGFSTIITAEHIGRDCFVNQQVTIGADKPGEGFPWIGDNVRICAGAIIVGNVRIGNNACIGAGAVVVKDVNDNEVVAGVPAKVIAKR